LNGASLISVILFTVKVAAAATLAILPAGVALAYLLARRPFAGRTLVEAALLLPLAVPPVATGFLLLLLLGRNGPLGSLLEDVFGVRVAFTWVAAAIASGVMAFPLLVVAAKQAFESVDPRLEALSRTLGRGRWRTFASVTLPLAARGLVYGTTLAFARALGEFGATSVLAGFYPDGRETVALGIFSSVFAGDTRRAVVLAAISIALALGAILIGQSILARGRRETKT
jgi:molybdate transport system permease protein